MFLRGLVASRAVVAVSTSLCVGSVFSRSSVGVYRTIGNSGTRLQTVRMASGGDKFPAQKQDTQPGKEHTMDPIPEALRQEYRAANKLQVYTTYNFIRPLIEKVIKYNYTIMFV